MKIGIFAYNFEHKKTQEGLINLFLNGHMPECILAADKVKLNFYQSKIRVSPKGLHYTHPRKIAQKLGIPYHVVAHNSKACHDLIRDYALDLGVILGARILKKETIECFQIGILNMHPGLLPFNRGLDNLKWAILKGIKQGVSCHLISEEIDKGRLVMKEDIDVFPDDTLVDIFLRIQDKEQELMLKSLDLLKKGKRDFKPVAEGSYFKAVPPEQESKLMEAFKEYKKRYSSL